MPGERVLVVDDEAQIRKVLRHRLEVAGYEVLLAEDGEQAL
jgi:two-component system KDP operon response regulator KdpE